MVHILILSPHKKMSSPREVALRALKLQRHIRDVAVLERILDATASGYITNPRTLRDFVEKETNLETTSSWAATHWKKLATFKANSHACTDLVVAAPSEEVVVEPTDTMKQMTDIMNNLYVNRTHIPLVPPPRCTLSGTPEFDRNDLYLTNRSELLRLLDEPREVKYRLCLLSVVSSRGRKYVTWGQPDSVRTMVADVNTGRVILNDHVTSALQKGERMTSIEVLAADMGQLIRRDVDHLLYCVEMTIDRYACRHPHGLNPVESCHLVHRSLMDLGGDWDLLRKYGRYTRAKDTYTKALESARDNVGDAVASVKHYYAATLDPELDSMVMSKCIIKRDKARESLHTLKREYTNVCSQVEILKTGSCEVIADMFLRGETPSDALKSIRAKEVPTSDDLDDVERQFGHIPAIVSNAITSAMRTLGMTEGVLTKDQIRAAYRRTQKRTHSDKTKKKPTVLPETIQHARDVLMDYIDSM